MKKDRNIILASNSPRRSKLLHMIGIKFDIIPSRVNEEKKIKLFGKHFAEYWSRKKAISVSKNNPDRLIVGADTIVIAKGKILGKPRNKEESIKMLKMLSDGVHHVITGVTIFCKRKQIIKTFSETTKVSVLKIPEEKLIFYINNFDTLDKAGSYGIQDWFSVWIKKIDGCYFNVMGLPLSKFYFYHSEIMKKNSNNSH
ncbi:MAG: Maf family nucleotide pyrophosphatase [Candidatus Neomarinimicrobiota bacterium]